MDEIDEIVDWQLSEEKFKRTPRLEPPPQDFCPNCGAIWHGLPVNGCLGSHIKFNTP